MSDEARIRYRAFRRGFRVMCTRGRECKRREKAGVGPYMLLNQATNSVALFAATLADIAIFLRAYDQQRHRRLH